MTEKYEVATQQAAFFSSIEKLAANPKVDVAKIQQIMNMQEHILDRNAKQAFNAAMMRVQSKIDLVVAKTDNSQTGSKYADLKEVIIKTKPIYTAEGFSLMFYEGESKNEKQKRVCVDIMHEQGHTEQRHGDFTIQTTGIAGKAMMTQIHGEGSTYSYGRRYLTCMIFNIPTGDDDDGNAAGGKDKDVEMIAKYQKKRIEELVKTLDMSDKDFKKRLSSRFEGIEKVDDLYTESADILIRTLEKMIEVKNGIHN